MLVAVIPGAAAEEATGSIFRIQVAGPGGNHLVLDQQQEEGALTVHPGDRLVITGMARKEGRGVLTEPHTYLRGDGIMTHYFSEEEVETLFPTLVRRELSISEWSMRIKGEHVIRSEIIALFRK